MQIIGNVSADAMLPLLTGPSLPNALTARAESCQTALAGIIGCGLVTLIKPLLDACR